MAQLESHINLWTGNLCPFQDEMPEQNISLNARNASYSWICPLIFYVQRLVFSFYDSQSKSVSISNVFIYFFFCMINKSCEETMTPRAGWQYLICLLQYVYSRNLQLATPFEKYSDVRRSISCCLRFVLLAEKKSLAYY